jgi:hypothetical protein
MGICPRKRERLGVREGIGKTKQARMGMPVKYNSVLNKAALP